MCRLLFDFLTKNILESTVTLSCLHFDIFQLIFKIYCMFAEIG